MRDYILRNFDRAALGSMKWKLAAEDELPLWVADMDFPPPPEVSKALENRVESSYFPYSLASQGVKDAFSSWCRDHQSWDPSRGYLTILGGVLPGMSAAVLAWTRPGEGVVVQTPVYPPFMSIPACLDREVFLNPLVWEPQGDRFVFSMDIPSLEDLFRDRNARLLYLCSPHNPAGRVWSRTELLDLAGLCRRYGVTVVSDEIHGDLIRPGHSFLSVGRLIEGEPGLRPGEGFDPERTLVIQAPSKTFNIPGIGSGLAWTRSSRMNSELVKTISRLGASTVNIFSLVASEAAYTHGQAWLKTVSEILEENSAILDSWLGVHPAIRQARREATYLAWLEVSQVQKKLGLDGTAFQAWLRKEARVYLSPGPQFGPQGEGWIRINLGCSPAFLEDALARIAGVIEPLGF